MTGDGIAGDLNHAAGQRRARHILFVCTGNTGRSVMAEALARAMIAARGLPITVGSRGLRVDPLHLVPESHALTLLAARGIDASAHRATPVTEADVAEATDILTMTEAHREGLVALHPSGAAKTRTLAVAAGASHEDIADAFGAPRQTYERVIERLATLIAAVLTQYA